MLITLTNLLKLERILLHEGEAIQHMQNRK